MSEKIVIGISDQKTSRSPDTLVTYALGSCVGIMMFDPKSKTGGLAHIMLPTSSMVANSASIDRMKFADTAVEDMLNSVIKKGARKKDIRAKIAGGANMFKATGTNTFATIGARNIEAVRQELKRLGIPLVGEDVGNDYGRTVYFFLDSGKVEIQSLGHGVHEI